MQCFCMDELTDHHCEEYLGVDFSVAICYNQKKQEIDNEVQS